MSWANLKAEHFCHDLFAGGRAPITNILAPSSVHLEGSAERQAYMLDVNACSPDQLRQIAKRIAQKFASAEEEVLHDILTKGLPIRASQVQSVSTKSLAFL